MTREERVELHDAARKAARDADTVSDAMRNDVMQLLELFGVPYMVRSA